MKGAKTMLSVVVPCYNEEKSLPRLATGLSAALRGKKAEMILVDNGSDDGSAAVMSRLAKDFREIRVVKVRKNTGYGNGVWEGLRKARGEFVSWTHADLQADPQDVARALEIAETHGSPEKVFVKGRRRGRPALDSLFTFFMSCFCSLALKTWMEDINAQPNLFRRQFLTKLGSPPKDFSFDLYALYMAKRNRMDIIRFPVAFGRRLHGASSWNTGLGAKIKFIKRTIAFTLNLRQSLSERHD